MIAMKDYTFIRPGVAVTISAVTLVAALLIGVALIRSLQRASLTVQLSSQASATLHQYNAALEVWREMQTGRDPGLQRPEARDRAELSDARDQALVNHVLDGLRAVDVGL